MAEEFAQTRGPLTAEGLQHAAYEHEAYQHQYGHDAGREGPSFGI